MVGCGGKGGSFVEGLVVGIVPGAVPVMGVDVREEERECLLVLVSAAGNDGLVVGFGSGGA